MTKQMENLKDLSKAFQRGDILLEEYRSALILRLVFLKLEDDEHRTALIELSEVLSK